MTRDKVLSWLAVAIVVGTFLFFAVKPAWCFWPWDCF